MFVIICHISCSGCNYWCLDDDIDLILYLYSLQHDLIIAQAPLLLFSTLNGTLIAVDSNSGEAVWHLQEGY